MPPWRIAPRNRARERHKRWAASNPEKARANSRRQNEYQKQWRKENRALVNAQERKYRAQNRDHYNLRMQAWRYGLTKEQLAALIAAQEGHCAICKERSALHVDHDHTSGKIRSLLCTRCNKGLGFFQDRADLLEVARKYLLQHQESTDAL
jgi:hypothetical protein